MANYNGIVHIGGIADLITLAAGETLTWTHNQGVKAVRVETVGNAGQALSSFTIAQPSANAITVNNGTAGPLATWVRVTFEDGTIGLSGALASTDASLAIA